MAWKPKTILGKILKVGVIAGVAVGGVAAIAASGGTAAPAVVSGAGFFGKLVGVTGKVVKGAGAVIGKGVQAGANLISGVTAQQRDLIADQKAETKTEMQKLTTIEKLMRAGASVDEAASKVGVPISNLKGLFGVPSDAEVVQTELAGVTQPVTAGQGCAAAACLLILTGLSAVIVIVKFVIFS